VKKELEEKLVKTSPLLYADRHQSMQTTAMCWGFSCGDGWFDIIWQLSLKLEPLIIKLIEENPSLNCSTCSCKKDKHYGYKTKSPGKCLSIHTIPYCEEPPPANYRACWCEKYKSSHPRAAQVKEKFGGLRFYMTSKNDEIHALVREAEQLSYEFCEECGKPGQTDNKGWIRTLCEKCRG